MKSIKLILLSIALIAHSVYPMATLNKIMPIFSTICVAMSPVIGCQGAKYKNDKKVKNIEQTAECLNDIPEMQPLIKELLDTYADGKDIKIYSPYKNDWSNNNIDYCDAYVMPHTTKKIVCIGEYYRRRLEKDYYFSTSDHYDARATIGHELGHIKNAHIFDNLNILGSLSAGIFFYKHLKSSLYNKTHWTNKLFFWSCYQSLTNLALFKTMQHVDEYYADQNIIQCAKDPRDLRGYATYYRKDRGPDYTHHYFSDPHPHPITRAERCEKAADELEKRLAQPKSL